MIRRFFGSFYARTTFGAFAILAATGLGVAALTEAPADRGGWRSSCAATTQTQEREKLTVYIPQGIVVPMDSPFPTTKTTCTRRVWTCPEGQTCDPARRPPDTDA